jgi:hypothetical protein
MANIVLINPRFEISYGGLDHAMPFLAPGAGGAAGAGLRGIIRLRRRGERRRAGPRAKRTSAGLAEQKATRPFAPGPNSAWARV